MKIAFLLYGIPQNGGTKVLFHVGNLLHNRGHELTYYVADAEKDLPFPSDCNFVFASRSYPNAIGRIGWLARVPIVADIAIATSHHTAYSLVWSRSLISRRMYYVQAYEPDFYSDSLAHLLTRWPMMLAAGASYLLPLEKVVNCEGSRRGLTWKARNDAPELPPGIDLGLYHPRSKQQSEFVIGHISRREDWKGSDHFFRAMVKLRHRGHKFTVLVAYDLWPDTHGLQYESIHPRTETELSEYYSGLDVLVSTVTQKGSGYPPLEAMACGAVCIATPMDFGTPGVDHIPILPLSSESILRAIEYLLSRDDRQPFIDAGLKTASLYGWDRLAERWGSVLSKTT